jgi:hypothetical protein
MDLCTNGAVVINAIEYVQSKMDHLILKTIQDNGPEELELESVSEVEEET